MQNGYKKSFDEAVAQHRKKVTPLELSLITRAFDFSYDSHKDQLRKSGAPYFEHCYEVALTLLEMKMDSTTIAGGLLHDVVEDTGVTIAEISDTFGEEVALLVDGVTKISELKFDSVEKRQAENFRKMIISMVKDIRVIMIKFADRLHNMRTLEFLPEQKRKRIAIETRDVYAPLAHRLGIARIKWELEDLTLKVLDPKAYWSLVNKVSSKRVEREAYIAQVTKPIQNELKQTKIKATITGRPKHFYSIYGKMHKRQLPFEQIYDLLAIRIIVKRVEECYFALGLVHSLYVPVQDRFKDYIATPKSNFYQSLHTTVVGPDGTMVEIQIRTEEMHSTAEDGIAAHWRYKEGVKKEDELDKQIAWLRQVMDWQQDTNDASEFMENLRIELFQEEIFVFTPKGDLFKLPVNSTPVDFAFEVHTDVGMHCIGAKVNGKIQPLSHQLKSGDSVEILTSVNQTPNPDWMKFVRTSRARSRIKRWMKDSFYDESLKLGKEILDKQIKKLRLKIDFDLEEIAHSFNCQNAEELYARIGSGDASVQSVIGRIAPDKSIPATSESLLRKIIKRSKSPGRGIKVQGLDNLMMTFGKCCQPLPGDIILGFIAKGRGIVVHRRDCRNVVDLLDTPERTIDVEWDVEKDKYFVVRLYLLGEDRRNFLRDVSESIAQAETNIVSIEMKAEEQVVHSTLTLEIRNLQHLTKIMKKIRQVKGVLKVERLRVAPGKREF